MSDHISGPRALAEPIADITDVFAFPSPETPGDLVLVLNTLPFAPPDGRFSDGLIYRFRLRPLTQITIDRVGDDPPLRLGRNQTQRLQLRFDVAGKTDAQLRVVFHLLAGASPCRGAADASRGRSRSTAHEYQDSTVR